VILQAWGSAALLVAASALVGHAVSLLGGRCRPIAPAVGLSLLIVVAYTGTRLPGRASTAAALLLILVIASGVVLVVRVRRGTASDGEPRGAREGRRGGAVATVVTIAVSALGAAIPFIANGRIGLLGVSLDNDTAPHLIWGEALRSPVVGHRYGLNLGYPLGPHSLAAALTSGLGVRMDLAFTALLIATVVVTALVAANALVGEPAWKRPVVGVLAALLYMVAAYYAEGAFKEPMLGLLLLAMVLQLEQVRDRWAAGSRARWLVLLPVSALIAGGVYVYSYLAFAWFGLTVAIWLVAELVIRPGRLAPARLRQWRSRLLDLLPPALLAAVVMLVLLVPIGQRIISYLQSVGLSPSGSGAISASNLGNLAHALSAYEALGIWQNPDFRFLSANVFHQGELSALALGVLVLGMARALGRRQLILPAAVTACAIVYWRSSHGQSPYVTAKALVIAGPVVAVTGLRGLLHSDATPIPRWLNVIRWAAAVAFVGFAVHSSYQVLRNEPVWASESTSELLSLGRNTSGQTLLFLGNSDYAPWIFHDSEMSALAANTISMAQAAARPRKPIVYGTATDFDSVDPSTINRFRWVITTTTPYASQPPPAFRLVRRLPMYELWERVGTVSLARQVIERSGAPGAVLDCRNRVERALSRRPGVAAVSAVPVSGALSALPPGGHERVTLRLPAGRWQLSLQYTSPTDLTLSATGHRWRMPAYDDRPGPIFGVGSLRSSGSPLILTVRADKPNFLTGADLVAFTTTVFATRDPDRRTLVPLSRSCGRYVDWYRLSG
jgi:hypothetical protein